MATDKTPPPSSAAHWAETRIGMTLETYVLESMLGHPAATGAFASLLNQISLAAKLVTSNVRRAGLAEDVLGYSGATNVQGEQVMKLDEEANETLIGVLGRRGHCAAIASEEEEEIRVLSGDPRAKYVVVFDPLDGSSNIDVNISIGTIFGVLKRDSTHEPEAADFMKPGTDLLAAGYVIYGSSTMLVLTTGKGRGVHGFTYDPSVGEFFLSHPHIRIPEKGKTYSINEGNHSRWSDRVKKWNKWIKESDAETGRPYGLRYVGTLVADAHRTLLRGGVFAYPPDEKNPGGKLRLLYEANPFAAIIEAAGGKATDGVDRILDIQPTELHQRTPLVLGSPRDVDIYAEFMRGER